MAYIVKKTLIIIALIMKMGSACGILQYQRGGTCCSVFRPNCGTCSAYECSTCQSSSYCLQSNRCPSCSSKLSQCSTCSSCSVCLTCSSNQYTISSSQCVSCSSVLSNCAQCSSTTVCTACSSNAFTVVSNVCTSCSTLITGCAQCSASSSCTLCTNNIEVFSSANNKCGPCSQFMSGCSSCSSSTVCTACINNNLAINSSSKCQACSSLMSGCSTCSSSTVCTACANNTYAITNANQCALCFSLMTGCLNCNTYNSCTQCVDNTYIINSSSCVSCSTLMANCLNCTSFNVCINCASSYVMNSSSCVSCSQALSNCASCSSTTVCTSCVDSTFTVNSSVCIACSDLITDCLNCSSPTVCTNCINDQFAINSTKCIACSIAMVGCTNCSSLSMCTACVNNTYAINSTISQCQLCQSLMPYCFNCSSQSVCITCLNNSYYLNPNTSQCDLCSQSLPQCIICSSQLVCTTCVNNTFAINTSSNTCAPCSSLINLCQTCNNDSVCVGCGTSPNIAIKDQRCYLCSSLILNCLNCTSSTYCTVCRKYYLATQASSKCTLCNRIMPGCIDCSSPTVCTRCSYGRIVVNGCSSVAGCVSVVQGQSTSICNACNTTQYLAEPKNGVCQCLKGHVAGQYCTAIVGCTNIIRTFNRDICSMCSQAQNFLLQEGICVCKNYYSYNGVTCTDKCGDGRVISLPCDDGNLIDGDGCSSTCQIQPDYICNSISSNLPSLCKYKGWIKLQLSCIYKLQNNKAEIILSFNPFIRQILRLDFTGKLNFTAEKNCTMSSFQMVDSMMSIQVDYGEDIEGSTARVVLEYDQTFILSPNGDLIFSLTQCEGDRLNYDPQPDAKSNKQVIEMCIKILSLLAVLGWILGSYSHKMIGVETLQTFQIIFLTHTFASRYSPVVKTFIELNNVLNIYQNIFKTSPNISIKPYNRLKYSADFISNFSVAILAELLVLTVLFLFILYTKLFLREKNDKKQAVNIVSRFKQYKQRIYDCLIFPIFMGFYLNLLLSLTIYLNLSIPKTFGYRIQSLLIIVATIPTLLVFFWQLKYIFVDKHRKIPRMQNRYASLYLMNIFLLSFSIQASLFQCLNYSLQTLSAIALIHLITIIVYQPYHNFIHNFSIIVNQIGILGNLGWIISQNYIYIKRSKEETIALIMIMWLTLVLILAFIRILFELRRSKHSSNAKPQHQSKARIQKQQKQLLNSLVLYNSKKAISYRLHSQLMRQQQMSIIQSQQRKNFQAIYGNHIKQLEEEGLQTQHIMARKQKI